MDNAVNNIIVNHNGKTVGIISKKVQKKTRENVAQKKRVK